MVLENVPKEGSYWDFWFEYIIAIYLKKNSPYKNKLYRS